MRAFDDTNLAGAWDSPLLPLKKQSPYRAVILPPDHSSVSSRATFM